MRTIAVVDEPELTELLAVLVGQGFRIADRTPTSAIVKRRHRGRDGIHAAQAVLSILRLGAS